MFTKNLQIHIARLLVVFIFASITRQVLYTFSQFLRLRRLHSDDSDFSKKSEAMCRFFDKHGYPVFVVSSGPPPRPKIDRQSALQTAEKENTDRIPFTLTLPSQPRIKSIILSFKRDINTGTFMFRSSFQTNDQPGTFRSTRSRCKTCPFIHNVEKMSGPKRSIKITDHSTCPSANVISCINCTHRKKLYIG